MVTARSKRLLALGFVAAIAGIAAAISGGGAKKPPGAAASSRDRRPEPKPALVTAAPAPPRAPASAAPAAPARRTNDAAKGEVVVKAPWGSDPGQLGRSRPSEGAPEGPMSIAVDGQGRLHVLDQVNSRIQIFEKGKPPRVISLPADTYQDITVDSRGNTFVLDRLATRTVAMVDESGGVAHSIPLAGPGVAEPGGVTGVFARDDGVWIEVEHASLVRIADASGAPEPARPVAQGRFSLDGASLLLAALAGPTSVLVSSKPVAGRPGGATFSALVQLPMRVIGINTLESDAARRVYVAVDQIREAESEPFGVVEERETVVVIGQTGAEIGRVEIAPPEGPEEQLHPIRVSADGVIYQLICRENAAYIEKYTL